MIIIDAAEGGRGEDEKGIGLSLGLSKQWGARCSGWQASASKQMIGLGHFIL